MIEKETVPEAQNPDAMSTDDPVGYDDEDIVWQGSPSQVINIGTFIWWSVLLVAALVALGLWNGGISDRFTPVMDTAVHWLIYAVIALSVLSVLFAYLSVRAERTTITRNKIKEARGITSIFRQELFCEISDIKDFKSPPAGLMGIFGLSNLIIETNDEDQPVIKIRAIADRDALVQKLLPIWRKMKMDRKGYFGDR